MFFFTKDKPMAFKASTANNPTSFMITTKQINNSIEKGDEAENNKLKGRG